MAQDRSAYFVRPAARVFMDARQSSRLSRLFVQVDPADPCRQWQAMAKLAGIAEQGDWHCERTGEEMIGAQNTIRYRAVSAPGGNFSAGSMPRANSRYGSKRRTAPSSLAENIRDEPQPAQLFEIPPGFRKFDPQILIQQIKQSDVWVAKAK